MEIRLSGIKKIYRIPCRNLPRYILLKRIARIPVYIPGKLEEINFFGENSCTAKRTYSKGANIETSELNFYTNGFEPYLKSAYIITDVNNNNWVIGTYENDNVITNSDNSFGSPAGSPACIKVSVSFTDIISLIPVTI